MAKAPGSVNGWDGSGNVWFKIAETGARVSGGAISWPAQGKCEMQTLCIRPWTCFVLSMLKRLHRFRISER